MKYKKLRGFTLLELSVVLVILGILSGMTLVATLGILESAKAAATQRKLDVIEQALYEFRLTNNRLPCPGDLRLTSSSADYGLEATQTFPVTSIAQTTSYGAYNCMGGAITANYSYVTGGLTAHVVEGAVPVRILNLPDDFMYDGWGRKISYVVTPYLTIPESFAVSRLSDNCNVKINDDAAQTKASGAVYALLSHGPNGHGGYTSGGQRVNAGVTNADEQSNCHCDSSAVVAGTDLGSGTYILTNQPTFVQKASIGDTGSVSAFDDIVRYKMRWQLQTEYDVKNNSYIGPPALITMSSGIQQFTYQCGYSQFVPLNADTANVQVAYTPKNEHIFTYTTASSGTCRLYKMSGATLTSVASPVDAGSCPSNGTAIAASNNGYIAMLTGSSPYLQLWKLSGDHMFNISNPISPVPTAQPTKISLSGDAMFLVLSPINGSNHTRVYMRGSDNRYVELGQTGAPPLLTQPASISDSSAGLAFSPDGKYLAVGSAVATGTVKLWRFEDDSTFTSLADLGGLSSSSVKKIIKFSPDSKHLAVAIADILYVYSINDNSIITQATGADLVWIKTYADAAPSSHIRDFSFSPNSEYITVATDAVVYTIHRYAANKWGQYIPVTAIFVGTDSNSKVIFSH